MTMRRITPVPLGEEDDVWDPSTPHDILEQSEQNARVHAMLDALRPDYREVLILKEFEDMRYAEIAMITGSTESAVRSRIFKARRALSELLAGLRKERTL
jgi:RNA polymerase sigma-70 factor (ECF subfamily)